jgi:methionyl-tRNA formyltransferase
MFDTIILLTSVLERPIFTSVLSTHNPCLTIIPAETLTDLNALAPDTLARARLIAYAAGVVVPAHVLDQLGYGAYNFHPGPPAYPGWGPPISRFTRAPLNSARPRMSWSPGLTKARLSAP